MKIYLAGIEHGSACYLDDINIPKENYYLGSFYYFQEKYYRFIKTNDFMLDSGAFTFMENSNKKTHWANYIDKYASFINKHDIDLFFELDIDSVVGYGKVKKLRKKLEEKTNKKCIPVWHKSRGKKEFINLCKKYNYIAIGGIVSGEINKKDYKYFDWFIKIAHKNNAKIHALGLAGNKQIKKYNFDSVDSASWTYGNIGGYLYKFDGQEVVKIKRPQNKKIKNKKTAQHNFKQWIKWQQYADRYL